MTKNTVMNSGWRGVCGLSLALMALVMPVLPAQAFMLSSTRVVMPEGRPVSVGVISGSNEGVLLIRSRVTRSLSSDVPVTSVMISPPLFRLEKGSRGTVRLQAMPSPEVPQDRESVFYLSVAGIPSSNPLSPGADRVAAGVVIGTGLQVKAFYRPRSLDGVAAEPWKSLTISRVPGGVKVTNPTPFHLTFSRMDVDGKPVTFDAQHPTMVPPFDSQVYGVASTVKKTLHWTAVNDIGGEEKGTSAVQ
ncbi:MULTISPECIES: molecular chaperone [Enterobacter]|uniref:fimbrial biogenesis chaperone n=1 Tax=Enterobacter TaxID=547 RepID=UPI001E61B966|nr:MULTISPECIES: molecular chaperone [Enterobacter]MCE1613488.1 molecular chaperone [Enterobacter ludwigii]MCE1626789.1 molecular chaperone [Enterobacter ludwigii]GLH27211.1 pilus assembly protein [Enterobacter sp. 200527-13]